MHPETAHHTTIKIRQSSIGQSRKVYFELLMQRLHLRTSIERPLSYLDPQLTEENKCVRECS